MNQAEFKVTTDLALIGDITIDANFEECEKWLEESLDVYRNLVITEENLSEAKAAIAKVRKTRDGIDLYRKEVKKTVLSIYSPFEEKAKTLTTRCDDVASGMAAQVKVFEDEKKRRKIEELRHHFEEQAEDVKEYVSFDSLLNPKWSNVTYSADTAKQEIDATVGKVKVEVKAISALKSPFESALLKLYKEGKDLDWIFDYDKTLREQSKEAEEKERAVVLGNCNHEQFVVGGKDPANFIKPDETMQTIAFKVTGTAEQIMALKRALKQIGLKPERV